MIAILLENCRIIKVNLIKVSATVNRGLKDSLTCCGLETARGRHITPASLGVDQ